MTKPTKHISQGRTFRNTTKDDEAYKAHIAGPYFQEYNKAVQTMVTDKTLIVNKLQDVTLSGKI